MAEGRVLAHDGIALLMRGDLFSMVYKAAANLEGMRWLFDQADRLVANKRNGFMSFLVILPSSDPPDAATRRENVERTRAYGRALRRMVTVPVGDEFRMSVVRTIMRGQAILERATRPTFVARTVDEGIGRVLEDASAETPSRDVILKDLRAMFDALGIEPHFLPKPHRTDSSGPPRVGMGAT